MKRRLRKRGRCRWKTLAEIYTVHSFAPFGVEMEKTPENHPVDPQNLKEKVGEKEAQEQRLAT